MSQLDLSIKRVVDVPEDRTLDAQQTMTAAIVLCQQMAGVEDKVITGSSGVVKDVAQWSRIKSGQHYFPQDKFPLYMDLCGNEAPLRWLARKRGYSLVPLETELERQLRIERAARAKAEERLEYLESLHTRR